MANLVIPGGRRALPTDLTQAEKDDISAAAVAATTADIAAVDARVDDVVSVNGIIQTIFIDGVNGSDNGDGSLANPKQTIEAAFLLVDTTKDVRINLLSDINFDQRVDLIKGGYRVQFNGVNATNTAAQRRKISVLDATNNGARPAGFALSSGVDLSFSNLDIELNSSRSFGFIETRGTLSVVYFRYFNFTRTGSGPANLLFNNVGGAFVATFVDTDYSNAPDYLFWGQNTGDNPNTHYAWSTNISNV